MQFDIRPIEAGDVDRLLVFIRVLVFYKRLDAEYHVTVKCVRRPNDERCR